MPPVSPPAPASDRRVEPTPHGRIEISNRQLASGLRLAVARLARRLRQQSGDDVVTASQLSALASVERRGPLTLGELAACERVQPPSMTRIVARLEELDLVSRSVDPADRRVSRLQVTPVGRRHLQRTRTRKDTYLADRLSTLDPHERDLLAAALPVLERLVSDG